MALAFLVLVLIFLVGGLDAVDIFRESIASTLKLKGNSTLRTDKKSSVVQDEHFHSALAPPLAPPLAPAPSTTTHMVRMEAPDDNPYMQSGNSIRAEQKITELEDGAVLESKQTAGQTASSGAVVGLVGGRPPRAPIAVVGGRVTGARPLLLEGSDSEPETRTGRMMPTSSTAGDSEVPVDDQKSGCCGLGATIKKWLACLPLDKLKILVVVWQILTVFPTIAAVDFPPVYSAFLSWIDVVNLDLGHIFSASCLFPNVTHYERLLATTLAPLFLGLVLLCTYQLAIRRVGIGSAGIVARQAAWSRHVAAGLLLTFLVSRRSVVDVLLRDCDGGPYAPTLPTSLAFLILI